MKKGLRCLFAGWTLFYAGLVPATGEAQPRVIVKVSNSAGFDERSVAKAEEIVTGIFHALGIQVAWQNLAGAGADQPDFWINLVPVKATVMRAPEDAAGLAALPEAGQMGSLIWVFRPTLEKIVDDTQYLTPQRDRTMLLNALLAYTITHEMGHLLLGSAEHSGSGIMTLGWDLRKIRLACIRSLSFLPRQSERIRDAVRARDSAR